MESSRDSSVWRNLAVTFGGGLALGAVGMKLTQTALRPVEVTPRPQPNTFADRLTTMERRLERVEQTPARPAAAGQLAANPIDQKVLEAVIGAVDARLHEQAVQMDRRLADLEARMAVIQSGHQQDRQSTEQLRQEAAAVRAGLEQEIAQARESASRAVASLAATQTELQMLRHQNERIVDAAEQRFADMRQEYRQGMADLRSEVEQSVEARIVTAAAATVAAQMEEQLAPLRAEVQQKEQELSELRQRLADSEKSVLDVVLAIGEVCRQAADRVGAPRAPRPAAPPPVPALVAPIVELRPQAEAAAPPPAAPAPIAAAAVAPVPPNVETLPVPQAAADPALAPSIPDFLHDTDRRTSWRIPLVSSILVSTGYLVLMHYLSASLQ